MSKIRNDKEDSEEIFNNKGNNDENIAIQSILEDYRKHFKLIEEQLKEKMKLLSDSEGSLGKI